MRDLGAGNYFPRLDNVASPKNLAAVLPDTAVMPNGPESVRPKFPPDSDRPKGPDAERPKSLACSVVFTKENFCKAMGTLRF